MRTSVRQVRRPSRDACTRKKHAFHSRGQVLPAALGFLLIASAVFYLMVNAGQTLIEKTRVANAADAAAYSVGVVEARALNYDAYMNRAIVANEIVIAQMVSMASWIKYFGSTADNYPAASGTIVTMMALPKDPEKLMRLNAVFLGSDYLAAWSMSSVSERVKYLVDGAGGVISIHQAVITALSFSQTAVQLNLVAGIRQEEIARDVVHAMDPDLRAEVLLASHGFDSFTVAHTKGGPDGDDRARLADVTTRSRDPFTRERNWTLDSFDLPLLKKDGALKKRGGTDLVNYDEWRGVDTLELHGRAFGCRRHWYSLPSWCNDIQVPVGAGGEEVDAGGGDTDMGHHGNAYAENGNTAHSLAEPSMAAVPFAYFTGLPSSRDLAKPNEDAVTAITVRVSKDQGKTLTSGNAATAKAGGRLALFNDRPAAGRLTALSRAQVFFDRIAARADGKEEIGSLYNPHWRVRLVPTTAADKAATALKQDGLFLP